MNKILATLGPSSLESETIKNMEEHVDMFRLNMSHAKLDELREQIELVTSSTEVPLCLDSEGAQIRNQNMKGGKATFTKGEVVKIHFDEVLGDSENISFTPPGIAKEFAVGDRINIDFDLAALEVIETTKSYALAKVTKSGEVGSRKASDVSRELPLPHITDKDVRAFNLGLEMGLTNFALSFANSKASVEAMRELVGPHSHIISKIESCQALQSLEDIIGVSDAILIDRGDMSRQVPIEKIPFIQRRVISIAKILDTPAYVATNLLESMINSRTPTRAEINDIVSTVLMGADGLVLAAETAVGKHPLRAVEMVSRTVDMCRKWTPNTTVVELLNIEVD